MNGRNSIKGGDRPYWTTKKDRVLGKIFKNTRGSCRPRRPTSPTFFSDRFLYTSSFFGALGFFSYPLAGHLPLRKGRPRCRIYEEGLGQKRGRRMRTRQARDDSRWSRGCIREEGGRTENREEIEEAHHPGVIA